MPKADLNSPRLYVNRELSWLEFNDRVFRESLCRDLPLLERMKFLAIVSSNLDEFFMIRVAGLKQQVDARVRKRGISGMTPGQQLARIAERAHRMMDEQARQIAELKRLLAGEGVHLLDVQAANAAQRQFLASYFHREILPVLTPLTAEHLDPWPALPGLRLMLALRLRSREDGEAAERIAVVPMPGGFPRFVALPAEEGLHLVRLEDVIAGHVAAMFPADEVAAATVFRLTRDADVEIQEDAAGDLLEAVEQAVRTRRRRSAVRLEVSAGADERLRKWLVDWTDVRPEDVYEIDGMLDAAGLMEVATRPGLDDLRAADWPAQPPQDLLGSEDLLEAIRDHDVLLMHPYESFEPVIGLLERAAEDPDVLAIKQTLYRTSGDSPVIAALERAARNGKQVVVLVELKARFDEERNVNWARRLEDAGAYVIYGIAGYKTHAKALLILRREPYRLGRYVHLSTGNYNDRTAKLYSDIGLMTTDNDIATDTAAFFNLLTGASESVGWSKLTIAPTGLRGRFVEMIEREVQASTPEQPGLIMAKVNSLQDKAICKALYRASREGVRVRLNVRGICCLRPGIEGVSENIEVISIIDKYLEHARMFYFRNGGHEEVYLSSADWMSRNLLQRLEILFPVTDPKLRRRLIATLSTYFADNVKARRMLPDGTYQPVQPSGEPLRAQEALYQQALRAAQVAGQTQTRFRPLTRPKG